MEEDVKRFFNDWPEAFELFKIISSYIYSLGNINIEVMKTQISFGTKRKFAWVWLPQTWVKKRPGGSITVTFVLDHKIEHPQIEEVAEPNQGKWTHHVVLESEEAFTAEVRQWLKEAYEYSF